MNITRYILIPGLALTMVSCGGTDTTKQMDTQTEEASSVNANDAEQMAQLAPPQVLDAAAFKAKMHESGVQLIDVRTPEEVAEGAIENSVNIDISDTQSFEASVAKLDKSKPVLVYCKAGGRSARAAEYLYEQGFEVYDLEGGYSQWPGAE